MGTFGNGETPYELLPAICKHFVVAVRPNPRSGPDGLHIHMAPEMTNINQYIIAIPFTTKRFIKGTWPVPAGRTSLQQNFYVIDQESLLELHMVARERMTQWESMCRADPGLAVESAMEYRVRHTW